MERDSSSNASHTEITLDQTGTPRTSAMSTLVSLPVSFSVEDLLNGKTPIGLSSVPTKGCDVERWLNLLKGEGISVSIGDRKDGLNQILCTNEAHEEWAEACAEWHDEIVLYEHFISMCDFHVVWPASILGAGLYELERWCCLNSGWRELGLNSH